MGARKVALDVLARGDEVLGVVVVLLQASGDGENVGVEDDVVAGEADLSSNKE